MMKDIPGYEGLYAAAESGEIWSLAQTQSRRRKALKPYVNTGGYLRVNLYKDGKVKHCYVHRLIAETWLPNPMGLEVVNHIDTNVTNNHVRNLEWCSQESNIRHSRKLGNQNDVPVRVVSVITGEIKEFPNLKTAGEQLFGRYWALREFYRKKGDHFYYREWEVWCNYGNV